MGPVWHKQKLVNIVAVVVALDMAAAMVAISARSEIAPMNTAGHARTRVAAGPAPSDAKDTATGAAGQTKRQEGAVTASGSAGQPQAPATSTTAAVSGAATGTSRAPTGSAASASGSRQTTTAPTRRRSTPSSGSTATTAPVPVGATGGPVETPDTTAPSATDPDSGAQPGGSDPERPGPAQPSTTTTTRKQAPGPSTQAIDDRAGDTVVDGTGAAKALNRADLRTSKANYTTKAILLAVQTAEPVDPKQDPRWASENTYVSWDIDTNLDGTVDYIAEFFVEGGELGADVTKADDATATSLCGVEAAYSTDGYTVGIDPACIGNPAAFAYRATIFYDTSTEVVTDSAPDTGWARSVGRPKS